MTITRRDFIGAGAVGAASLLLPELGSAAPRFTGAGRPAVVSSDNGIRGVKVAYDKMMAGGDPLDAAIAGVNIQELDPEDQSVGLGGLPNAEGIVQLDSSCMHGPSKRAGSVASLEDIATPSLVAKAVMDYTDHVMLVGPGARKFAIDMGFPTQNLLTDKSRLMWLRWRANLNPDDALLDYHGDPVIAKPTRPPRTSLRMPAFRQGDPEGGSNTHLFYDERGIAHTYGTINMCAVTATGDIGSVTTTSGLSWKIPGRIGDSPIIGAGQYCDNEVGAAGSTGRGEATIKVCGSFLAVEFMRQGMSPEQALMKTMERVIAMTEKRLLNERGRPYFDLQFYAINKKGEFAGATAYQGGKYSVCDAQGPRQIEMAYLFKKEERPTGKPISGTLVIPK